MHTEQRDQSVLADSLTVTMSALTIMLIGVLIRFSKLSEVEKVELKDRQGLGEAFNVAQAFAKTGTISDSFAVGQGPTAHLMPLPAIIAGTVYRVFGIRTELSGLILTTIALCFVFTAFWFTYKSFRELGSPATARLMALAIVCFSSINILLEDIWFRLWDGAMAAALGAFTLYHLIRVDRKERITTRDVLFISVLTSLLLFISPPFGPAGFLCAGIIMVRRLPRYLWPRTIIFACLILVAVLSPWAIRNYLVLGHPIILRDNFGLELGQANDSSLLSSPDADGGVRRRHDTVHPWGSRAAYTRMVAVGGEVAYSKQMEREAFHWISTHPSDFFRLTARHLRTMTFPALSSPVEPKPGTLKLLHRVFIFRVIAALGFIGITFALWKYKSQYLYAAIMVIIPILPYLVVEANLRYRYIIFTSLVFFATDFVARSLAYVAQRWPRHPKSLEKMI